MARPARIVVFTSCARTVDAHARQPKGLLLHPAPPQVWDALKLFKKAYRVFLEQSHLPEDFLQSGGRFPLQPVSTKLPWALNHSAILCQTMTILCEHCIANCFATIPQCSAHKFWSSLKRRSMSWNDTTGICGTCSHLFHTKRRRRIVQSCEDPYGRA